MLFIPLNPPNQTLTYPFPAHSDTNAACGPVCQRVLFIPLNPPNQTLTYPYPAHSDTNAADQSVSVCGYGSPDWSSTCPLNPANFNTASQASDGSLSCWAAHTKSVMRRC